MTMTDGAAVIVSFLLLIPTTQANCVPSAGGAIDPIVGLHRLRGEDEVVTSCVGISWWTGSDAGLPDQSPARFSSKQQAMSKPSIPVRNRTGSHKLARSGLDRLHPESFP